MKTTQAPTDHQRWLQRTANIYRSQRERFGLPPEWSLDFFRGCVVNLFQWQASECQYCRQRITRLSFTLDHDVPLSRGGSPELANLVLCCAECNTRKGQLTGQQFRQVLSCTENWPTADAVAFWGRLKQGNQWRKGGRQ